MNIYKASEIDGLGYTTYFLPFLRLSIQQRQKGKESTNLILWIKFNKMYQNAKEAIKSSKYFIFSTTF